MAWDIGADEFVSAGGGTAFPVWPTLSHFLEGDTMGQLFKNTASQKVRVFAFADAGHGSLDAGEPVTGDSGNITAQTALDNAALGASNDTNPAEVDSTNAPGVYEFDPTQAETNGDVLEWYPKSSTAGVQVVTIGGSVQTLQPPNLPDLGIESDGHVHGDVKELAGSTVQQTGGHIHAFDDAGNAVATSSQVSGLNDPTAASVADAVWDEARADHTSAGTFGEGAASVQGNVTGSVGSISGVTFPGNFGDLSITATTGLVDLNDKTGFSLASSGMDAVTLPSGIITATSIAASALNGKGDWSTHSRADVTGGAYPLATDSNGRIRLVDGSNTGEARWLVDAVWDEVITGAQHNVNNSAAKFLREAAEAIGMVRGTAQSATSTTLVLAAGDVTSDGILDHQEVKIVEGTGAGQARLITDSVASSDTITVDRAWDVTPDSTSVYAISGANAVLGQVTHTGATIPTVTSVTDAVTVGTNNDKAGYALTSAERNSVADAILTRDISNVEGSLSDHMLGTFVMAGLESDISGTTWTIYQTDGATQIVAKTLTTDANADPITGVD